MWHVGHVGERKGAFRVWWRNPRESKHLEDLGIYERIILQRIFKE
jgi:hypothetical protein